MSNIWKDGMFGLVVGDALGEIDYKDIMERFTSWYLHAEYTPFHDVFDIGNATATAILKYEKGAEPFRLL